MFKLPTPNAAAFISPPPRGMGPTGMPSAARYCRCRSSSSSCFCARNSSRAASPLTHGASNVAGRTWPTITSFGRPDLLNARSVSTIDLRSSAGKHRWIAGDQISTVCAYIIG